MTVVVLAGGGLLLLMQPAISGMIRIKLPITFTGVSIWRNATKRCKMRRSLSIVRALAHRLAGGTTARFGLGLMPGHNPGT
jgi:hypothetical protein